jgi:hypothetical protein
MDRDSIPVQMALQAMDEEVGEDVGWTPVISRRKKTGAETVDEFWRQIGYPTPLSRHWEKPRRPVFSSGEDVLFCRSVDVYASTEPLEDGRRSPSAGSSPPNGSGRRSAFSSPSGIRLARNPKIGPWHGPLPRRRITPLPILGQFFPCQEGMEDLSS